MAEYVMIDIKELDDLKAKIAALTQTTGKQRSRIVNLEAKAGIKTDESVDIINEIQNLKSAVTSLLTLPPAIKVGP